MNHLVKYSHATVGSKVYPTTQSLLHMFDLEIWPEADLVLTWLICCRCATWRKQRLCVCWCRPSPFGLGNCVTLFYPAWRPWLRVWLTTRLTWQISSSRLSSETLKPTMFTQTGKASSFFLQVCLQCNEWRSVQIILLSPSSRFVFLLSPLYNLPNRITEWSGLLHFKELPGF